MKLRIVFERCTTAMNLWLVLIVFVQRSRRGNESGERQERSACEGGKRSDLLTVVLHRRSSSIKDPERGMKAEGKVGWEWL
jgi:hypothetical protein